MQSKLPQIWWLKPTEIIVSHKCELTNLVALSLYTKLMVAALSGAHLGQNIQDGPITHVVPRETARRLPQPGHSVLSQNLPLFTETYFMAAQNTQSTEEGLWAF